MSSAVQTKTSIEKERRRKLLAAINVTWKEIRPDLGSGHDLRDARLDFASAELNIPPIGSYSELTNYQLGKVLEAMLRERVQPRLNQFSPRVAQPQPAQGSPAEVLHLCSNEQAWAIGRVLNYLGWSDGGKQAFLERNFKRKNQRLLSPRQAQSAIRILLNIAASGDIKARFRLEGKTIKVSQAMIRAEIPGLKRRLGLDVK